MKKIILGLIVLTATSCSDHPTGALTNSISIPTNVASCPPGRHVVYEQITVTTYWETGVQNEQYSWQCTKNSTNDDTYRVYKDI